ncbi:MAG: hypothetical protein M5U05_15270 [Anaerolineales bacterium]|jgi:hypothetical protein|nr:hypothetical protein [Anaerolineales bacterium]
MPRIRCHYIDCVFLDDGYCGAAAVEIDPDAGCMTYSRMNDLDSEKDWGEETEDLDEWEDLEGEDEDDEIWLDESEEY